MGYTNATKFQTSKMKTDKHQRKYLKDYQPPDFNISATPPYGRIKHHHPELEASEAEFLARTEELLNQLAEQAGKSGIRFGIRHEYWSLLRGVRVFDVLEKLPENAGIDVDVASLAISGENPVEFIRNHIDRVRSVHLTDTAFTDNDETWKTPNPEFPARRPTQVYRDIGQGKVDLSQVYQVLDDLGYDGPVTVNCRQTRDHMRALLRMRAHVDKHFLS